MFTACSLNSWVWLLAAAYLVFGCHIHKSVHIMLVNSWVSLQTVAHKVFGCHSQCSQHVHFTAGYSSRKRCTKFLAVTRNNICSQFSVFLVCSLNSRAWLKAVVQRVFGCHTHINTTVRIHSMFIKLLGTAPGSSATSLWLSHKATSQQSVFRAGSLNYWV